MSFASLHFLLFIGLLFGLSRVFLGRLAIRKTILLAASYYFYAVWDWRFLSVVLLITLVNFLAAPRIASARSVAEKRLWLAVPIAVCLGVLAYFKYANFLLSGFVALLRSLGVHADMPLLQIVLPIGISFFTFQALSYSIDVYRGKEEPCHNALDFSLFVAFFPTLLSGPITRSRELLPQFRQPLPDSAERLETGLILLLRGFIKKVAFADIIATHFVNPAFAEPGAYSPLFLLLAVYAYSLQIYMDLSGYTDIARGSAKLLGFELPENFNRPYLADSVSNFWQRWHISMSGFFRDYLYFAVGGSKRGNVYLNLLITFVAIGIWHGAGVNFVIYGLIHGAVVGWERWLRGRQAPELRQSVVAVALRHGARIALTFNIIAMSRILFRAPDVTAAAQYVKAMALGAGHYAPFTLIGGLMFIAAVALHLCPRIWLDRGMQRFRSAPAVVQAGVVVVSGFVLIALAGDVAPFIYFQF